LIYLVVKETCMQGFPRIEMVPVNEKITDRLREMLAVNANYGTVNYEMIGFSLVDDSERE
jgi:hypothetical protein